VSDKPNFIWHPEQQINTAINFRSILGNGPQDRDDGTNRWFLFRKTFNLTHRCDKAELRIFADSRYKLYLNGRYIGRGPGRASPNYPRYDHYSVQSWLKKGVNVIAVLVHVYGVDTAWYERARSYWQGSFGDGALWCRLIMDSALQPRQVLESDTTWRCLRCAAWRQNTPRKGWGLGFIEEFDAQRFPADWLEADFDDSHWRFSQLLCSGGDPTDEEKGFQKIAPFPLLQAREIPPLLEQPVLPIRVLRLYAVEPDLQLPIDRRIFDEVLKPLPEGRVLQAANLLCDDDSITEVRTTPDHDVCLLLAFEKIQSGFPYLEIDANGGEVVDLAVAETIPGEYGSGLPDNPRLVCASHLDGAHLFRYTAMKGLQRFQAFESTAIRYMQVVVRNAAKGIRIRKLGNNSWNYPLELQGEFECSDEKLNRLWKIAAYTISQCTHDAWEDCPSREQRQWVGDGAVRYPAAAAAFGSSCQALDRRFLLTTAESQRSDGLLQMFAPGDHHQNGVIIPDFSLHWVMIAWQYLLHTGDVPTLEQLFPVAERILAWFQRLRNARGLLVDLPYWHFIEWAHVGRHGEAGPMNGLYCGALLALAKTAEQLDNPGASRRYSGLALETAQALETSHWDTERQLFVDEVDPDTGQPGERVSQHTNSAAILWDIAPSKDWAGIAQRISNPNLLRLTAVAPVTQGDADFDPKKHIIRANTFFSHFVYSALAKAERFDLALAMLRTNYLPMLASGTTTLWESFEPSTSLCHAFSTSPLYQLSRHLLGVEPTRPGFREFTLQIQPADIMWAKGCYPSPLGAIRVSWQRTSDALILNLEIPPGALCHLKAPVGYLLPVAAAESSGTATLEAGKHRLTLPNDPDSDLSQPLHEERREV